MSNTITGKVLSIGETLQIAGKDPSRPFLKRELVIDCTRYDPVTGERSPYENTPLLEFTGELVNTLDQFKVGDVVTVTFDVEGRRYTDRNNQQKIFTRVRPFRIEGQPVAQQPAAPAAFAQPQQQTLFPPQDDQMPF